MTDSIDIYYATLSELKFVQTHTQFGFGFTFMRLICACMLACQFTNSWISFNLSIVFAPYSVHRIKAVCWTNVSEKPWALPCSFFITVFK